MCDACAREADADEKIARLTRENERLRALATELRAVAHALFMDVEGCVDDGAIVQNWEQRQPWARDVLARRI